MLEALAVRWGALGRLERSADYLSAMTPTGRALALAGLLAFVAGRDERTRQAYVERRAQQVMPSMHPVHQAALLVELSRVLTLPMT